MGFRLQESAAPPVVVVAVEAVDIVANDLHTEPDILAGQIVGDQQHLYLALNL